MKLSEATYFPDATELTRHGFVSHMEDFIGKLIGDNPLKADVDDYLKGFDIDAPKALELLTKPEIDGFPESAVVIKTERIKNGGYDENGKPMKDEFQITYKVPKKNPELGIKGIDEKLRNMYIKLFENHTIKSTILEDDCGGDGCFGGDIGGNDGSSSFSLGADGAYPYYDTPLKKKNGSTDVVRRSISVYKPKNESKIRRTMYITEAQMQELAKLIKEDGEGGGALTTQTIGSEGQYPWYDAPFGTKSKKDPTLDHSNMFKKAEEEYKWKVNEEGIHIDPENEGKFNATKKRTGKSTEELTHSKNSLTRKRAIFAQNAKKWHHE